MPLQYSDFPMNGGWQGVELTVWDKIENTVSVKHLLGNPYLTSKYKDGGGVRKRVVLQREKAD